MNRRRFLLNSALLSSFAWLPASWMQAADKQGKQTVKSGGKITPLKLSNAQWRERLTPAQYYVLREAGTERPGSSPLNREKRDGVYHCVGCDLPLFDSGTKYDSGTGWPSFYAAMKGHVNTSTDYKLFYPRTEYHCARCGGHQGHVFDDGPKPTGQRWCNNGIALKFVPRDSSEQES